MTTNKAVALTGLSITLQKVSGADLWLVYLPKGDQTVDQPDGTKLRVNPSRLSAQRMEAARRLIAGKGAAEPQPYTDYNHDDQEASGRPLRFAFDDKLGVIGLTRRTEACIDKTAGDPPEFQAFSPHVPIDPDTGEAFGLYLNCGGFVNRPLFGSATSISAAAHLSHELVAADPNDVALVSSDPEVGDIAAQSDVANQIAAEKENRRMKELIAKLCAAFKITKPVDQVTEAELIAAFDTEQGSVATLTARAGMIRPVITALGYRDEDEPKTETLTARAGLLPAVLVGLGFTKDASPKPEELTAKIVELGKPGDAAIGKELIGFAVSVGIIAPAEQAEWEKKMAKDREGWTKELIGKTPSVLIGKIVKDQTAAAGGEQKKSWKVQAEELIAKDPSLKALAEKDFPAALSRAIELLNQNQPAAVTA